jgi:isopentenyldiphosphate isomerase
MEQIDIFDEEFNAIEPFTTTIDVVHRQGLWHQTFACWLLNPKENKIFLQLRGPKNRIGPNTFDASASGHLSSGEKPIDGFREVAEELGKHLNLVDKTFLGINRNIIIQGTYINREFCHIYIAKTENNLSEFDLQEGEVMGIFALDITDGINLFSDKLNNVQVEGKIWDGENYKNEFRSITKKDFCSYHDRVNISGYYLKVMIMADRYIKDQKPLRI